MPPFPQPIRFAPGGPRSQPGGESSPVLLSTAWAARSRVQFVGRAWRGFARCRERVTPDTKTHWEILSVRVQSGVLQ